MRQEQRKIYPSQVIPAFELRPEGIPFRWLESLVESLKRHVPAHEQDTCMLQGYEHLTVYYSHTLSPLEEALAAREELETRLREIRGLLPRPGEEPTPEVWARLRVLSEP